MNEDKKKPGTQLNLLDELVCEESPTLQSVPRSSQGRSDHGPNTIDLFTDNLEDINKTAKGEIRKNASRIVNNIVDECTSEMEQSLRQDLTEQLAGILAALHDPEKSEKH